ncbi:MAG: glucose-1-phosphate adenylyltransferase, partial [Comamonadaceae bacterium]
MDHSLETHQLVRRSIALVLAGGRGSRLKQLTDRRAKPAVYFGGKFRIIDFALSNCINSGIRRVAVVTQYKSHSLMRHLQSGWNFLRAELGEMVEVLPAQQRVSEEHWYRGTADAVYQNADIIRSRSHRHDYVVVLAGDHIYKMDYSLMLRDHVANGGGCTVGCIEVPRAEASAFGVMAVDENRRVTAFIEKPADPPPMPGNPDVALASMGIYVFDADYLNRLLEEDVDNPDSSHDFGKDIIPRAVAEGRALAHPFGMSCVSRVAGAVPYWRDVGTIDAFWSANLDLASVTPELDIYDNDWPIWTYQRQLPPAKFVPDRDGNPGQAV